MSNEYKYRYRYIIEKNFTSTSVDEKITITLPQETDAVPVFILVVLGAQVIGKATRTQVITKQ